MSLSAAESTQWYATASMKDRVALREPATIGADSEKSTMSSSPSMATLATISTSRISIPSESMVSVNSADPSGHDEISRLTRISV
jgi:hypothetical protein